MSTRISQTIIWEFPGIILSNSNIGACNLTWLLHSILVRAEQAPLALSTAPSRCRLSPYAPQKEHAGVNKFPPACSF